MHPRLFTIDAFEALGRTIGPLTLHSYGVLLAIGFLMGLWAAARGAKREGLDAGRVSDLAVYVLIAGLLGAKLMLVLVEWPRAGFSTHELFTLVQSGGVFYGGLLAALPVAFYYARRYGLPAWKTADALAPGVAIGQAIGRLGCFCAGCCHGRVTDVAWAVRFEDEYAARTVGTPLGVGLHPTQIYESVATFLLFAGLLFLARRKRFDGQVTLVYVALYSAVRFTIEFFRGDVSRGTVLGGALSTSQGIAILLMLGVLIVAPAVARRGRKTPPAEPVPEPIPPTSA